MRKKGISGLTRKVAVGMLAAVVFITGIGANIMPVQATESNAAVVTTREEFFTALEEGKSPITVNGTITVDNGADSTGKMLPVEIPANTVICGGTANDEGISPGMVFRGPLQITGDNVVIRDIELHFISSTALGSVPHREIFLAGHSLTLDNVSTYLEGADESSGGLFGSESELLPSVYAGGFEGTTVGNAASLRVENANENTVFQGIYLGHDAGTDKKTAYLGEATLKFGKRVSVRDGIFSELNSSADIEIVEETGDASSNNVRALALYGNANTQCKVSNIILSETALYNVGSMTLDKNAVFTPSNVSVGEITVKNNACLNLTGIQDVIVSGDFNGGAYDAHEETDTRGVLVLQKEGSLTV